MTRRATASDPSQLLLFDAVPVAVDQPVPAPASAPVVPAPAPVVPAPEPARPAQPPLHPPEPGAVSSTPVIAPSPAVTLSSVLAPAVFRHPQAAREIVLNSHLVAYEFKRSKRRSIGFVVGTDGLSVNAPKWVGVGDVEAALREKGAWILRKLAEQQKRAQRLHAAKVDWRDGTSIPFLGEPVIVVLDPRAGTTKGGALLNTDGMALPGIDRKSVV